MPLLWFQIPLKLSTTIQDLIGSEDCTAKIAAVAIQKTSATKNVPHSLHVLCPTMLEFSLPNLRHQFMRFFSLANGNDAVHVDVLARFQHGGPIRSRCSAICPMHAERTIQKANVANSDPNICETYTKSWIDFAFWRFNLLHTRAGGSNCWCVFFDVVRKSKCSVRLSLVAGHTDCSDSEFIGCPKVRRTCDIWHSFWRSTKTKVYIVQVPYLLHHVAPVFERGIVTKARSVLQRSYGFGPQMFIFFDVPILTGHLLKQSAILSRFALLALRVILLSVLQQPRPWPAW